MTYAGPDQSITPLMRQYHAIKTQHPDKILFFRMGDFYEMFGDDAVKAAPMLGIALTSRAHGNAERIPLAGVPYHSVDRYLARLLTRGEKVVIVEQVEDPKTAKGLVKREIVEILTPGTATVDAAESPFRTLCLAAVLPRANKTMGMALMDLSTGTFLVDEGPVSVVAERLRVMEPSELLYPSSIPQNEIVQLTGVVRQGVAFTPVEEWQFDHATAERELNRQFGTSTLEGFGVARRHLAIAAAGAVLQYLRENHRDKLSHVHRLVPFDDAEMMSLDYSSVRNLELDRNLANGTEENTLLAVINKCHTPSGARRLKQNLLHPFKSKAKIDLRLSGVSELVKNRDLCWKIREQTKLLPDLERLAGRLGIGRLSPRQMQSMGQGLATATILKRILGESAGSLLTTLGASLATEQPLADTIAKALVDEPPLVTNKGNIFRRGYSERLDALNDSIRDARSYIGSLQAIERERTGIATLKVGFNKVFGYYLEITRANAHLAPQNYIRKQTLVNAERYITPELKEKEELILAAEEKIFALETELFQELVDHCNTQIADIVHTASVLAEIDLVSALADLAVSGGYCRPQIFDDRRLVIENGRHPVIEAVLPTGAFVANDLHIEESGPRIIILTGPNMSGKSTYLRQIGLIVIMAQIGSFVPADKAEIGIVDRVFTRVGALDNLARGQSTFLVEMVETANILNNATERSLVLLDEVGRGTSTFDGLSVAWSVVEYINESVKARTVFATHYHELTGMASIFPNVTNCQVAVKRWEDQVVFLHKIIPGGCDDSYGIEVARLAGVPRSTLTRAKQILRLLESGKFSQSELGKGIYKEKVQANLFESQPSAIETKLKETDLDTLSPVAAFDLLRKLKEELP